MSCASRKKQAIGQRWTASIVLVMRRPSVLGEQAVHHAQRLSDQVSDNRHGQRWTPADIHGRSVAGHACCGAGSPRLNLASGRRGRRFKSGHPDREMAGHKVSSGLPFALRVPRCPILGARWEPAQVTVSRWVRARPLSWCCDNISTASRARLRRSLRSRLRWRKDRGTLDSDLPRQDHRRLSEGRGRARRALDRAGPRTGPV